NETDTHLARSKKLVVQKVETLQEGRKPTCGVRLGAIDVSKTAGLPLAPIMIYVDDVTHLLTEEGIAYLYKASSQEERQAMIAAVAGVTSIG
ncbi:malonate decarboxylase subunit alpha, partial [Acinetobacter baumannii]|uniref:malonate decarboxylase subunit alpha n=1 Tax=Acinetobacter baumannii TaxID=470 RepID=UPI0010D981E5